MPWKKEETTMELKQEFVQLADRPNANMSQLCRRYNISRPTGYKWLDRYQTDGLDGLVERSRRPKTSPNKTPQPIEDQVVKARKKDQGWGPRKLRHHLIEEAQAGQIPVNADQIPAVSTIGQILKRQELLEPADDSSRQGRWQRFERTTPNELLQMDFKGEFRLKNGQWCYPLTIIDDCTRFGLAVQACRNQRRQTVKERLKVVFSRYGLPEAILCDNGGPWGSPIRFPDGSPHFTRLAVWLIRLGIEVKYSRPNHPQSKGKNERFNGTLKAELLHYERFSDFKAAQQAMTDWRERYNTVRPHEALDMHQPATRYTPSNRELPSELPPIQYGPDDATRKVSAKGKISFRGQSLRVGKAFEGHRVAVRASSQGNEFNVYFCNQHIRTITLNQNKN